MRIAARGNPVGAIVLVLALAWLLHEITVSVDFALDRWGAYEGTVRDIREPWIDQLTLDFVPVVHLIIETDDGRLINRRVSVEDRAFFRIAVGDRVVKERGFGNHARVPGKPTVQDLLDAADR
jgi:hypothetical protein